MVAVRGEATRQQALAALRAFGLAEDEAQAALSQGLARAFFSEDPGSHTLRTPKQARARAPLTEDAADHDGAVVVTPTDSKDAARRLMLLRLLLSTLPVVLWAVDREGVFHYYEGKGLRKLGLAEGAFLGENIFKLFPADEGARYCERALAGEVVHGLWEFGGFFWENWCFPIREPGGAIDLVVFVSIDITESNRTEQELRLKLQTIERQQREISQLSTPIIEVWDKVLALPLLGVVDRSRAAVVMTSLLAEVVGKGAQFVLLDLTGVEAIDTATGSHLLDLIRAVRLLGAEGIITGIRPSVAQTMVTVGVSLEGIVTHANLRHALQYCLRALERDAR
jgi:rsbT co-antagonist protein RsbR